MTGFGQEQTFESLNKRGKRGKCDGAVKIIASGDPEKTCLSESKNDIS